MQLIRRTALWGAMYGLALEGLGASWDIAWHGDVGRDRFLTPPHELIVSGIFLLGLTCAAGVAAARRSRSAAPGLALAGSAAVLQAVGLAVDNWWHGVFGIDVTLWSPPHLLLLALAFLALIGLMAEHAAMGMRATVTPAIWAGGLLAGTTLLLYEYDLGYPHFSLMWAPCVLGACVGLALGIAGSSSSVSYAGSMTVAAALAMRVAALALNASVGRSVPVPPLGILAGGVAFDLARMATGRRKSPASIAAASALAWVATFPAEAAWLRAAGKTWWPASVLPAGFVLGLLTSIVFASAGAIVGDRLVARARAQAPGWMPPIGSPVAVRPRSRSRWRSVGLAFGAVGAAAVFSLAVATYTPTGFGARVAARGSTVETRSAAFSLHGLRASLWVNGGRDTDWVSLFIVPDWQGQGVQWDGGLTLGKGGSFSGSLLRTEKPVRLGGGRPFLPVLESPFGTNLAIWFVSGGQAWAGYVNVPPPNSFCIGDCGGNIALFSGSFRNVDGGGPVPIPPGSASDVIQTTLVRVASAPPGHPAGWVTPFAYLLLATVLCAAIGCAVLLLGRPPARLPEAPGSVGTPEPASAV